MSKLPPVEVIDLVDNDTLLVKEEKYKIRLAFHFVYDNVQMKTHFFKYIDGTVALY